MKTLHFSAKREATVEIPSPWDDMIVQKNMPALKFYHDFSCGKPI
jgi:hypothetical protein